MSKLIPNFLSNFFQKTIKRLILASFIFVLLVPTGFFVFSLFENSWDKVQQRMLEKHELIATAMVEPFSLYILSKQRSLLRVSKEILHYEYESTTVDEQETSTKIQMLLDSYQHSFGDQVAISYKSSYIHDRYHISTNQEENVLVNTPSYAGLPLSKLPTDGMNNIDLISPMFKSSISGDPVILLKHYVKNKDNNIIGALFSEISLTYITRMCSKINFGEKGHCAVVDQTGKVIAHPNEDWVSQIKDLSNLSVIKKMMDGGAGTTEFYSPFLKTEMVAGFTGVKDLGWGVMIPQPKRELTGTIYDLRKNTITWLAVGVLVALLVAYLLAAKITKPIRTLMKRTQDVDYGYEFIGLGSIPGDSPKEISQLWLSISLLLTKLQSSNKEVKRLNISLNRDIDKATSELKLMNKRLLNISSKDHLTALTNRRYISAYLNKVIRLKSHEGLGLLIIDVDKFKYINDQYGHEAGDLALKHIAKILKQSVRRGDLVSRFGGDEFVVYIKDGTDKTVALIAENLRYLAEDTPMSYKGKEINLSLSIGTVNIKKSDRFPLEDILGFADKAMYLSKQKGRNNVTAYVFEERCTSKNKNEQLSALNV